MSIDVLETVTRVRLEVCGRVQGVGYRGWLRSRASELSLSGWVRNLPNGRVEAELHGDKQKIEGCLELCRKGPHLAEVTSVRCSEPGDAGEDAADTECHFQILY